MGTPKASLGGAPLNANGPVSWTQTTGTAAPFQTFMVHEKSWDIIEGQLGQFVELTGVIPWKKLFLVREVPTSLPFMRSVLVSDIRYLWQREIIVRSMNIPRKTGDKRMVGGDIIELKHSVDTYQYADASLNDGARWRPQEAIRSVLGELAAKCGHGYSVKSMPIKEERELTVEGVEFADPGDTALGKLLMHIPHAEITVDSSGNAVVFDGTDLEASEEVMENAGPATVAGQIDRIINLDAIRPSSIYVYFAKEVELRFDSEVESDDVPAADTSPTDQPPEVKEPNESMSMENVLPLPDPYTTIAGKGVLAQGTYVTFKEALAAWNKDIPSLGKKVPPPTLNLASVRKHWWLLDTVYAPVGNLTLNAAQLNWAARISAIRQHYRQTFRINPNWMAAIRDLIPFRVGILDPVSGARAPSQAWSQYCIEPTGKIHTLTDIANDDDLQFYWLNCDSYPGIDAEVYAKAPSPALVQVADRDLGILHINYQSDRYQNRSNIHPSMMKADQAGKVQAPTRDLSKQLLRVIAKDAKVSGTGPQLPLAEDFRVAIVITAMPFTPNHEGRLLRWDVDPKDVQPFLSERFQVSSGQGRPWHIFVPPSLMTAWYALQQTNAGRIGARRLFGFDQAPAGQDNDSAAGYSVMNSDAMIPAMARAAAIAQWAAFVNQREGTRSVHLQPDIAPVGAIQSVRHSVGPDGRLITNISMPSSRRPTSALAFVAYEQRPVILGQIPNIKS
jgi:hypothetical protein